MDRNLQNLIQLKNQLADLSIVLCGYAYTLHVNALSIAHDSLEECLEALGDYVAGERKKFESAS